MSSFFDSQLCKSRQFCSQCRFSPPFQQAVARIYKIDAKFTCPNKVEPAIPNREPAIWAQPDEAKTLCQDCPKYQDKKCVITKKTEPWNNFRCLDGLWLTPPPDAPNVFQQALNFLETAAKIAMSSGPILAEADVVEVRKQICQACPFVRPNLQCSQCGCPSQSLKPALEQSDCPKGYWPK